MSFRFNILIFIFSHLLLSDCGEVLRPRGVSLTKRLFYEPSKDFSCIDGSGTIPFIYVNDDYCDCNDGSDEPGTPACPNGVFHCSNIGFVERTIPTSRINDGVCDCCDGSDEYNSTMNCKDICWELGKAAREAEERLRQLIEEGSKVREQYISNAKLILAENEKKLESYKKELESLNPIKSEKEALKKTAEEKERAALKAHQEKLNELKGLKENEEELKSQIEENKLAEIAFKELDLDKNDLLHYNEIKNFIKFDQDSDGKVSDDEAKFFLHMKDGMGLPEFQSIGWVIMKPYYMKDKKEPLLPDNVETEHVETHENDQSDPDEAKQDDSINTEEPVDNEEHDPEEHDEGKHYETKPSEIAPTEEITLPYDEETQALIDLAKKSRDEFKDVDDKYTELTRNIREAETTIENDYGPEHEFLPLQGQCFELTDKQYVYKLCLFDRASQSSSEAGSSEVNLGRWGKWNGPETNKYESMKYDGGTTCWNGPARSVVVNLKCGNDNRLTSASEPSRCEYAFDFETPALCVKTVGTGVKHEHTEL